MSARTRNELLRHLQLPDAFEDLSGVIGSDLKVIARALAERASDRLMLPPRQARQLQAQALEQHDASPQRDNGLAHGRAALSAFVAGTRRVPSASVVAGTRRVPSASLQAGTRRVPSASYAKLVCRLRPVTAHGVCLLLCGVPMARLILGVTGSVAAIRTPALFRALSSAGHEVRIVATQPALYFFNPVEVEPAADATPDSRVLFRDADEWPAARVPARRPRPPHRAAQVGRYVDRRTP